MLLPQFTSIIDIVENLIKDAFAKRVSDIHIEPHEHHCRIRFRQDGLLYEAASIPPVMAVQIISHLKVMAHLNIAEKRLPQDGRILFGTTPKRDIRLSLCPTLYGEKMVMRLLDTQQSPLDLHALGMTDLQTHQFQHALAAPQGLILVTGPTGSGKTITLYAALHHLNTIDKNISTVEDPIEIELAGINQVNLNPTLGLDFSTVLRTLLRQDPDIIMVGEIRDRETAKIALQAAQTGHLVLSTLHTNSARETLSRLQSLGLPRSLLAEHISLIIAQRLVRPPSQAPYPGRTGIFELFHPQHPQPHMTLLEAGQLKVAEGRTTALELKRVLGTC